MDNYTDLSFEYKWIPQEDLPGLTRRNMGIFSMFMNGFGLPDVLQEFVLAVFVAGNWDKTDGYDEIPLMRMAKSLATDLTSQNKLYNRLKRKSPEFFRWQENRGFVIIDRIILHEHTTHHKTKAKYKFVGYDEIVSLLKLPPRTPAIYVRQAVEVSLAKYPSLVPAVRKTRRKRPETTVKAAIRNIQETIELTGSIAAANLYFKDEAKSGEILVQVTDLTRI